MSLNSNGPVIRFRVLILRPVRNQVLRSNVMSHCTRDGSYLAEVFRKVRNSTCVLGKPLQSVPPAALHPTAYQSNCVDRRTIFQLQSR